MDCAVTAATAPPRSMVPLVSRDIDLAYGIDEGLIDLGMFAIGDRQ